MYKTSVYFHSKTNIKFREKIPVDDTTDVIVRPEMHLSKIVLTFDVFAISEYKFTNPVGVYLRS